MPQDVKKVNNLSISNIDDWTPPTEPVVPSDWKPPSEPINVKTESPDKSNLIDTVSKHVFEAPEFIKKGAKSISDYITEPTLSDQNNSIMPYIKGAIGGMTEGAASLLSPANIASIAMPEVGMVNKGLGALQGVSGANKLVHGDVSGLADLGFGMLGMRGGKKPEIPSYSELANEIKPSSQLVDEAGRALGGHVASYPERPAGPWDQNIASDLPKKSVEELQFELAKKKFNMGHDLPSDTKPVIKDYWITDANGKKVLNPKYQPVNRGKESAVFKGWQEDGEGGHFALYDIVGGPLDKSTVSDKSLKAAGIEIPETPPFEKNAPNPAREAAIARTKGTNYLKEYQKYRQSTKNPLDYNEWNKKFGSEKPAILQGTSNPTLTNLFADETGAVRFGPNKAKAIKDSTRNLRQPSDEVIDRLTTALKEAGPKRIEQEKLYSQERSARIKNAENVTEKGLGGFYKQLHELKGELPKVDFERTKLKQSDVNDLINYVTNSPVLLPYEKIRAKMGLLKMLSSKREELPQRSELALLSEVFGPKFDDVIQMHGGLGGPVSMKVANEAANLSKSIMASVDMSAPLRQGLPLIHRKEWWNSIKPMVESFGSQERFDALQDAIKSRPGYLFGKASGLKLTDLGEHKEEAYASHLANLIPGVKMSERAYVGFLNKLRADTFDSLVQNAVDLGHDPDEIGKAIAKYVNVATGRGDLGRLDPIAKELNTVFFSPRLISSRLTMLNPQTYVSKDIPAFVRKESLKSLLAVASFGLTMDGLAHAMGASVNLNPTNSDFMKARFGNTRLDPNGGFQQYIVAATRLLTGQTTSSTTGKTSEIGKRYGAPSRVSMMIGVGDKYNRSFLENKFSPLVGLADDILAKRAPESQGLGGAIFPKSKNYAPDIVNRFVPLMVNDLIDVYKDDPNNLPLGIGAALGMGMQTYKATPKKNPLRISVR